MWNFGSHFQTLARIKRKYLLARLLSSQKKHSHFIYESFKRTIPHKLLLWNILQSSMFWTALWLCVLNKTKDGLRKFLTSIKSSLPRCFFYIFHRVFIGWKLINSSSGMKICFNIPFLWNFLWWRRRRCLRRKKWVKTYLVEIIILNFLFLTTVNIERERFRKLYWKCP